MLFLSICFSFVSESPEELRQLLASLQADAEARANLAQGGGDQEPGLAAPN